MPPHPPPPPPPDWLQHALPAARLAPATAGWPLGMLLARLIRQAILEGIAPPASRLPSSRALAQGLGLARNTVVPVYDQLQAEGFAVAGQGSGTFVSAAASAAAGLSPGPAAPGAPAPPAPPAATATPIRLSNRGQRYARHPVHRYWGREPFSPGQADLSLFPHRLWARLQHRHLRRGEAAQFDGGEPGGLPGLREAIAEHVRATRGVRCEPGQVIITDGTAESIDLVARLLCDPGDHVLLEDPGYWTAAQVLGDHGLRLAAHAVDAQGLPVPGPGPAPRLVYLTPSNQFPTGAAMPLARRLDWLQYAARHSTLLLEDDYDSEFRYEGTPFPSLQGQDTAGRVIYLGTFSKTLFPGIRVAFLVVPAPLQKVFADASADFYRDGDQTVQHALADLLREGHYRAHVRALRREFGHRREALLAALHRALPEAFAQRQLQVSSGARGVHLTLALPAHCDDRAIARAAARAGVGLMPLSVYAREVRWPGLVLSFAATPVARIEPLVQRLAPVLAAALRAPPPAPPGA